MSPGMWTYEETSGFKSAGCAIPREPSLRASGGGAPDFPVVSWGYASRSPGPWLCPSALRVPSTS